MHHIGRNPEYQSPLHQPKSLKKLVLGMEYRMGNNLLHQFVQKYSVPNNSRVQNYISAVLRSLSGIDPNARNILGYTALDLAVKKRNYLMVRKLVSHLPGIDVNTGRDRGARSALHLAISLLNVDNGTFSEVPYHTTLPAEVIEEITNIIEFLISSGADLRYRCQPSTPLDVAVRTGHLPTVKLLVERGAVIDCNSLWDANPLHIAMRRNQIDMVRFLISIGGDVNSKVTCGDTLLHKALRHGCLEMVQLLVQSGADVLIKNNYQDTSLDCALRRGNADIVLCLLGSLGGVNSLHRLGNAPLHDAVAVRSLKMAQLLVTGQGADVNLKNRDDGDTPLHLAAKSSDGHQMVKFLIESGGDVNAVNKSGRVPLHEATTAEIAKFLVRGGADVDARNDQGDTPLHAAATHKRSDVVEFLIDSGADLNAANLLGNTPLHEAVEAESLDAARALVGGGAALEVRNGEGDAPLHLSTMRDRVDIVEFLVDSGADLNARGCAGWAPLHNAVFHECLPMVKALVDRGADLQARTDDGDTPLHWAAEGNLFEFVVFLVDRGADLHAIGDRGKTPLHCAVEYDGHSSDREGLDTVKFLVERGAVVDYKGRYSRTPLELAVVWSEVKIIEFLLSRGADFNDWRKFGYATPPEWVRQKSWTKGRNGVKRRKLTKT